jgi:hypothetical protein
MIKDFIANLMSHRLQDLVTLKSLSNLVIEHKNNLKLRMIDLQNSNKIQFS